MKNDGLTTQPIYVSPAELTQFDYVEPSQAQQSNCAKVRAAGRRFAAVILSVTRESADQSAALRKIRETVWTANACVVGQADAAPMPEALGGTTVTGGDDPAVLPCALLENSPANQTGRVYAYPAPGDSREAP